MIKTEQAADNSGVCTLKSLARLNCCDKPAVFKDSEIAFVFIYFILQMHSEFHFTKRMMLVKTPTEML